ncbi:hypothetical protein TNCV_1143651 [Trichonephila clavipes]|nr:hypothetical protein TNCV_1143651 [Trichonephila clavipes]
MSQQRDLTEFIVSCIIGRLEYGQRQRTVTNAFGVAGSVIEDCGIHSRKQSIFYISQDKIIHVLSPQIVTDISC